MQIGRKLILAAAALAIVPVALTAALVGQGAYSVASQELENAARESLVSVREARKLAITDYFDGAVRSVQVAARNGSTIEAMSGLRKAFVLAGKERDEGGRAKSESLAKYRELVKGYYEGEFSAEFKKRNPGDVPSMAGALDKLNDLSVYWQYDYIVNNPNPLGDKNKLAIAKDQSAYSRQHAISHPQLETLRDKNGFYDVFLVDTETDTVVYTAFKELDFTSNLETGIAAKSGLADAYRKVKRAKNLDDIGLTDYSPYFVSYNDQAAFLAVPIFDAGAQIGVLIVQLPLDKITSVMTANKQWKSVGLGSTGETYLVGRDGLLRSESRFLIENKADFLKNTPSMSSAQRALAEKKNTSIGLLQVKTDAATAALRGETGFLRIADYRGTPVLSAFTPFKTYGLDWALLAEIDVSEALAATETLARGTLIRGLVIGIGLVILATLLGYLFVRNFMKPVNQLSAAVKRVAGGDISARARVKSGDEMEDLGNAFDNLLEDRISTMAKAERENDQLNDSAIKLLTTVATLSQRNLTARAPVTEDMIGTVSDSINQLTDATADVLRGVTHIAGVVENASTLVQQQSNSVIATANRERITVQSLVGNLTATTDSMTAVAKLAQSSNVAALEATRSTDTAMSNVEATVRGMDAIRETIAEMETRIKRLGERSLEISQIVALITAISDRTHVLSLSASMQAALAGDAGLGFAVVAKEVQRLAESSRESTVDIANLVQNIQNETQDTIAVATKTIERVTKEVAQARASGERMGETKEATARLVRLVESITQGTVRQLKLVETLRLGAVEISTSTEETAAQLEAQGLATTDLVAAAQKLVESVSVFTLPAISK